MSIAIAGATGNLGQYIAFATVSKPFRDHFEKVKILTRSASKPLIKELEQAGATIVVIDYGTPEGEKSLAGALRDVTAVIDVQSGGPDAQINMDILLKASTESKSVKYYIPSQFGVDVRAIGEKIAIWDSKVQRDHEARASGKLKVLSIYPGLFLEETFGPFGPWLGFDIANKKFGAVGSPDVKFSLTSKVDIGLSLASIASNLVKSSSEAEEIKYPDHLRISGTQTTVKEAAKIFESLSPPSTKVEIEVSNLEDFKAQAKTQVFPQNLTSYLRIFMGEGKLDHTENHNNLVNPKAIWKWTSVEEYAKAVRPGLPDQPQDSSSILEKIKQRISESN